MEHPGEASTPFQGCVLFGTVNGTIGENLKRNGQENKFSPIVPFWNRQWNNW